GKLNLNGRVLCAPLAGVSNRPFRVMALQAGAAMSFTEMISSEGLIRSQGKTRSMMAFGNDEQPLGIQLFGANPETMRMAAEITVGDFDPDMVDINFGCPVKKVVNKNGGAAVLKDLKLTEEIVAATVEGAGDTPVSIKIRTGWGDDSPVYREVGQIAQKCGAAAITLHARSRSKGFSGKADWAAIKKLKEAVDIAVIGNGDVSTPEDARRMLDETGCDGVMIGRAALGNPDIIRQMHHFVETGELPVEPTIAEHIETAKRHALLMVEEYGETRGVIKMRRYLGWYTKGFPGATTLRPKLFQITTLVDIDRVFKEYLDLRAIR
ncbi:MAG: tRNA dihydrouridine synthase DusB, partial [candidate division Zixibacteria bacterium]|nr:tRNA dihydrouridine synthase DusB [candidate division Zixibacteria bacterium]